MMKKMKNTLAIVIWLAAVLFISNAGVVFSIFSPENQASATVEEDPYMTTRSYHVEMGVGEDNSCTVRESIDVDFQTPRHGIYRYIPDRGQIAAADKEGGVSYTPYYASVDLISTNQEAETDQENGNRVFRFGDEDTTVRGGLYNFTFMYQPVTQEGYTDFYYNIFPTGWQNEIPAGSTFSIIFPKDFPHELLQFYYGSYGEQNRAEEILKLSWSGSSVTGELTRSLPTGNGLTCYADMEDGYFTNVKTAGKMPAVLIVAAVVIFVTAAVLFLLLGRDEAVYPSIQYMPPDDLDSAAVGYIVDGSVSSQDIISLIVYWADKGYLKIQEDDKDEITFIKTGDLPENVPKYQKKVFNGIFGKKGEIGKKKKLSSLKYKFADTLNTAKAQVKQEIQKNGGVYTAASKAARAAAGILMMLPLGLFLVVASRCSAGFEAGYLILWIVYGISMLLLCVTVDMWYSRKQKSRRNWIIVSLTSLAVALLGVVISYLHNLSEGRTFSLILPLAVVTAVSAVGAVMTAFMKKRTPECTRRMGYLMGLREFIETAELERIEALAKDNPQWFYHILPFAYVFGLSDVWIGKFEQIAVPAPDWYENRTGRMDMFDLYVFHRCMTHNLNRINETLSVPKPASSSGGHSGGGFSGGGGGFSGGGFSGGGGGSW